MYKPGDLQITDPPCPDTVGNCDAWPEYGHNHLVNDARSDEVFFYPCAYLPHSCDEWVIGGPEQIAAMIQDLTALLKVVSQENDIAPLVDAAAHILNYPPPPLPTLPPGMPHNPGVGMVEPILYPGKQENDK